MRKSFILPLLLLFSLNYVVSQEQTNNVTSKNYTKSQLKYSKVLGITPDKLTNIDLYIFIDKYLDLKRSYSESDKEDSSFVKDLFLKYYNIDLERTPQKQFDSKLTELFIDRKHLKEGDLIFFGKNPYNINHVGVYLRNNKFIHSTINEVEGSSEIKINDLSSKPWSRLYFNSGRRAEVATINKLKYAKILGVNVDKLLNIKLYDFIDKCIHLKLNYSSNNNKSSSFMNDLFLKSYNIDVEHTPQKQFNAKPSQLFKEKQYLREGDLIFFGKDQFNITHVGLYLHNNKFVHNTLHETEGTSEVKISDLSSDKWNRLYFSSGRRYAPEIITTEQTKNNTPKDYTKNQLKYAKILDVTPDKLTSTKLYDFIDEWNYFDSNRDSSLFFVKNIFLKYYNIDIEQTAQQQFDSNSTNRFKNKRHLEEGDLIFFGKDQLNITYSGVYLHNNKFTHTTHGSSEVKISNLSSNTWSQLYFSSGRRREIATKELTENQIKYAKTLGITPYKLTNEKLYNFIDKWIYSKWRYYKTTSEDSNSFIKILYSNIYTHDIEYTAKQQFDSESTKLFKDTSSLNEGDLIFFGKDQSNITFAGVYLHNNKFVHTTHDSSEVKISDLSSNHWNHLYVSFGRRTKITTQKKATPNEYFKCWSYNEKEIKEMVEMELKNQDFEKNLESDIEKETEREIARKIAKKVARNPRAKKELTSKRKKAIRESVKKRLTNEIKKGRETFRGALTERYRQGCM